MSRTSAPDVPALRARLARARVAAARAGLAALLVSPGSDLRYLLGAGGQSFERLTCLVLPAEGGSATPTLVVPKLERPGYTDVPTDELGVSVVTWVDGEDPYRLVHGLLGTAGQRPSRVAVADVMPALHVLGLRDDDPEIGQVLAGPVLRELRMRKDAAEIAALRRAGEALHRGHARLGGGPGPGR